MPASIQMPAATCRLHSVCLPSRMVVAVNRVSAWVAVCWWFDGDRFGDDESDSYPRVGYRHFMDSSWADVVLASRICLTAAGIGGSRVTRSEPASHRRIDLLALLSPSVRGLQRGFVHCAAANGPHEAGQLARNGDASLVDLQAALVQRGEIRASRRFRTPAAALESGWERRMRRK